MRVKVYVYVTVQAGAWTNPYIQTFATAKDVYESFKQDMIVRGALNQEDLASIEGGHDYWGMLCDINGISSNREGAEIYRTVFRRDIDVDVPAPPNHNLTINAAIALLEQMRNKGATP